MHVGGDPSYGRLGFQSVIKIMLVIPLVDRGWTWWRVLTWSEPYLAPMMTRTDEAASSIQANAVSILAEDRPPGPHFPPRFKLSRTKRLHHGNSAFVPPAGIRTRKTTTRRNEGRLTSCHPETATTTIELQQPKPPIFALPISTTSRSKSFLPMQTALPLGSVTDLLGL
jgi:hypothetical protein